MKPATNLEHANVYLVINEKEIMVIDTGQQETQKWIVTLTDGEVTLNISKL